MKSDDLLIGNCLWVRQETHRDVPNETSIVISSGNTRSGAWLSQKDVVKLIGWLESHLTVAK